MSIYKNLSGLSNVYSFEIGDDFIIVKFKSQSSNGNTTYKYTYTSAGKINIEQMKVLAEKGVGLNSFINKVVRKLYESKW